METFGMFHDWTPGSHFFTVDVEEYFQVTAMEPYVSRDQWEALPSRVGESTRRLMDLLDERGARATMFVLGWIAQRHPDLVKDMDARGHVVASHGWGHRRVTELTAEEFRSSIRRSKSVLEELTGKAVLGYRAPSFSIVPGREWALDVLLEEGYTFDSSLFPIRRSGYGYPGSARGPHWIERPAGRIAEYPPATLRIGGLTLPAGGGAYFRVLPPGLVHSALRRTEKEGSPGTFYIHPWEIDPKQPRLPVNGRTRLRHYTGLAAAASRLDSLLERFTFRAIPQTPPADAVTT